MRLGVLDVGSNSVHLLVVDARPGASPLPVHSQKTMVRLAEQLDDTGGLTRPGEEALVTAVAAAKAAAAGFGVAELLPLATSALREAPNGAEVLARVRARTGVQLRVLSGDDEARLTFLAVRRWFGWSAGRLLVLDIGGGSLEIATGADEEPAVTLSLPLGAGRLTREWFGAGPESAAVPPPSAVRELTEYVDVTLDSVAAELADREWDRPVGTSKTFRSLARLAGEAEDNGLNRRGLSHSGLRQVLSFIRHIPPRGLRELAGVSASRAHQLLAGAVVAEALMRRLGVRSLEVCPWALRQGVILRRLDQVR